MASFQLTALYIYACVFMFIYMRPNLSAQVDHESGNCFKTWLRIGHVAVVSTVLVAALHRVFSKRRIPVIMESVTSPHFKTLHDYFRVF